MANNDNSLGGGIGCGFMILAAGLVWMFMNNPQTLIQIINAIKK